MPAVAGAQRSSLVEHGGAAKRRSRAVAKKNTGQVAVLQTAAANAVRAARRSRCPNAHRLSYAWSLGTGHAFELSCGSWACSWCSRRKKAAARLIVETGIGGAFGRGERVRFTTLTDGLVPELDDHRKPKLDDHGKPVMREMTVADLYAAWNRLRGKLRRKGVLHEFAAVVETQGNGRLHLHVLMTGRYLAQRRLSEYAKKAGFGPIADIREVKAQHADERRSAAYVSKEMAGYATKGKAEALAAKTAERRRPLRQSRGWCELSMRDAERLAVKEWGTSSEEEAEGPWAFIQVFGDGSLRVRLPDGEQVVVVPSASRPEPRTRTARATDEGAPERSASGAQGASEEGAEPLVGRARRARSENDRARAGPVLRSVA